MKHRFVRLTTLVALLSMLASLSGINQTTSAAEPSSTGKAPSTAAAATLPTLDAGVSQPKKAALYGSLPKSGNVKVIVRFKDAPLATYAGSVPGLKATTPSMIGGVKLNAKSAASQAYLKYLDGKHNDFLTTLKSLSPSATRLADYQVAINGVGLDIPTADVEKLLAQPEVEAVEVERIDHVVTDSSNQFIGTPAFWQSLGGGTTGTNAGENIVIGVIDTGIYNPSNTITTTGIHPSLRDPSPVGGDYAPPAGGYKGVCAATNPQAQDGSFGPCNDKLIGAWWYNAGTSDNDGEAHSPFDQDGHGTHTATTAGGNGGTVSTFGTISGVAPRARIISYKVCWDADPVIPDDGGCSSLDSTSAINQGILDDVDVFNFSISGGTGPWTESVELAFRSAVAAGIIVNTSAGNSGPTPDTVAHLSPWDITVAASTQAREFKGYLTNLSGGTGTAPTPLVGASLYPGVVTGTIKLAPLQATAGEVATAPSLCQLPYPAGTFQPTDIVICRRGINARVLKYKNVFAGGAGGGILVNATNNQGLVADFCNKVCVHFEKNATAQSAAGDDLIAYAAAGTASGTLSGGVKVMGTGDVMAGFSSTGPASEVDNGNILKPDITLIGVDVNAGNTAFRWDNDFEDGELFQVIGGTSMSSPHSAGMSALMRQKFPTWTPMEIKSALMTTAKTTGVKKPDATTQADPFNYGSGRVQASLVFSAGLTLNETVANMTAANPASGGDVRTLNLANVVNNACVQTCSWTRTVRNRLNTATTWNTAGGVTGGVTVTVSPAVLNIAAGATAVVTITASTVGLPVNGAWLFAQATLTEASNRAPAVHLPVAVIAAAGQSPDLVELSSRRTSGSASVSGFQSVAVTNLQTLEYGLSKGLQTTRVITGDSSNGSAYDNLTDGVFTATITVPSNSKRFVAQILASTSDDIDMFVARDANNDGIPQASEQVYSSATGAVLEKVDVLDPPAGTYIAVVQNWQASPNAPDPTTLVLAAVPGIHVGNLDVSGPNTVPAGQPFALNVAWDEPNMEDGDIWYGLFNVGTDAANPDNVGTVRLNITKEPSEVSVMASSANVNVGDYVTYTLTVTNYGQLDDTFFLTSTLPAGLDIDESSLTGGATYDSGSNSVRWNGMLDAGGLDYVATDSRTGGQSFPYTMTLGAQQPCSAACDELTVTGLDLLTDSIEFYGQPVSVWKLFTNGFMLPNATTPFTGGTPAFRAQHMPNVSTPNNLFAPLWTDIDLDGTDASDTGGGKWYAGLFTGLDASAPSAKFLVIQWRDAQIYNEATSNLNFNLVARIGANSEFCGVYGPLAGDLVQGADEDGTGFSGVSVGIENVNGTMGTTSYYNGTPVSSKPAPFTTTCFVPTQVPGESHTITFRAQVTAAGSLTVPAVITSSNIPGEGHARAVIEAVEAVLKFFMPVIIR